MYKHIEAINGCSFVDAEQDTRDLVFNNTPNPTDTIISKTHDPSYNNSDYSAYYFSTMGDDVHALHSNNMITPIRKKMSINTYRAYDKLMNGLRLTKPENGIYIVEYYNFYNNSRVQGDKILNHYLTTDNIEYSEKVVEDILNTLRAAKGKRGVYTNTKIRIITFVSEMDLRDQHYLYIKGPNIVLTYGEIDSSVSHPMSNNYNLSTSKQTLLKEKVDNVVLVEIVNNTDPTPYFIKIGNDIQKIYPNKSTEYQEGICVSTKRNGVIISDRTVDLPEHEQLGIYRSREACISNGDIKVLLEKETLDHERDKLDFEYKKLKSAYDKLVIEKDGMITKNEHDKLMAEVKLNTARIEFNKKEYDHEYDKENKLLDLSIKTTNTVMDIEHKSIKNQMDLTKVGLDLTKTAVEGKLKTATAITNLVKAIIK